MAPMVVVLLPFLCAVVMDCIAARPISAASGLSSLDTFAVKKTYTCHIVMIGTLINQTVS